MTVSPRDADAIQLANFLDRLSQWDVLNMPPGSHDDGPYWQREINVALHALSRIEARVHALERALGQIIEMADWPQPDDFIGHSSKHAFKLAADVARAVVLEGAARQEQTQDLGGNVNVASGTEQVSE